MKHGFKVMDSDLHTMEPDDLWVRYLDEPFKSFAPTFTRRAENASNQPLIRIGDLEIGEMSKRPHTHVHADEGYVHSHGWGVRHSHRVAVDALDRPRLPVLLALGIAGGLLPDPGALAILLAALASGKLVLGLLTVVVFSIGFASVLVVVGVVAARVGAAVLSWLSGRWVGWLQLGTAALIVVVGLALTVNAWRAVAALH